jgi:hypothetical protein
MKEFHSVDENIIGEHALQVTFDGVNVTSTQFILLLNCSSNEVELCSKLVWFIHDLLYSQTKVNSRMG